MVVALGNRRIAASKSKPSGAAGRCHDGKAASDVGFGEQDAEVDMIWDGTTESLREIQKLHPSAVIYAMQTKYPDGSIREDVLYGEPMLAIEDRRKSDSWQGWVFEIGEDVV